jgi:membrane protease YdiL (CAAX protease family)
MTRVLAFLLHPQLPLWQYCLAAFPIALIPSVAMLLFALLSLALLGTDVTTLQLPRRTGSTLEFFGIVVFAPIAETLLLAATLRILQWISAKPVHAATAAALLWGALHAAHAPLWFFGAIWGFFVFSCAYLAWRPRSFLHAFAAAAVPHALINLSSFCAVALRNAA